MIESATEQLDENVFDDDKLTKSQEQISLELKEACDTITSYSSTMFFIYMLMCVALLAVNFPIIQTYNDYIANFVFSLKGSAIVMLITGAVYLIIGIKKNTALLVKYKILEHMETL